MKEYISYYNVNELLKKISDLYKIPHNELTYVLNLLRKDSLDINYFNNENENCFYWAGFIAADGCVYKNNLIISLSEKDKFHLEKFKNSINYNGELFKSINKHSKNNKNWNDSIKYTLRFQSENIVKSLEDKFNIIPNKTLKYKFPKQFINHKYINHFIRGYVDGDGSFWIRKDRKNINFELRGTQDLLNNISLIFKNNLDITLNVTKPDSTFKIKCNSIKNVPRIVDFLYKDANVYLERKYNIAKLCYNRSLI